MLHRTQILLDSETKRDLEYVAIETNESMSKLARRLLSEKLKSEKERVQKKIKTRKMSGVEALLAMAKEAEKIAKKYKISGPSDLSINHDHYLYGAPKKNVE